MRAFPASVARREIDRARVGLPLRFTDRTLLEHELPPGQGWRSPGNRAVTAAAAG